MVKGGKWSSSNLNINPLGLWACIHFGKKGLLLVPTRTLTESPCCSCSSKAASAPGRCAVQRVYTQYSVGLSGAIRHFLLISGYVSSSPNSSSPLSLLLFHLCTSQKHKKGMPHFNQSRASPQKYPELVWALLLYCSALLPLVTGQCFGTHCSYAVSVRHRRGI